MNIISKITDIKTQKVFLNKMFKYKKPFCFKGQKGKNKF